MLDKGNRLRLHPLRKGLQSDPIGSNRAIGLGVMGEAQMLQESKD